MSYAANLARFAIVPSIVMHAAFNTVSRLLAGLFTDTQPNVKIPFDLVLALCGLATALVLVGMTKGSLAFRQDQIRDDGEIQRQSKSRA
jgi:hypothetical protein